MQKKNLQSFVVSAIAELSDILMAFRY